MWVCIPISSIIRSSVLRLIKWTDYVLEDMIKNSGYPQMLFLDLRPVNYPMVFVASHDIAEQISRITKLNPESVPKSPTVQQSYRRLIGANSIISEVVNFILSSFPSPH
jgi:hypothetical protein